ncbi:hypothetical protein [Tannerella forsythia]|uniref:Uncharacterized protein n=1 Tax=Tannerella forsythia TaxID=28112 RepID=A0A3P1YN82_TANFO|nr:hypothetical protein [Tannerella forsythia]RRD72459.1 hypothetical protein EII41_11240 [Tannerella forsythia]
MGTCVIAIAILGMLFIFLFSINRKANTEDKDYLLPVSTSTNMLCQQPTITVVFSNETENISEELADMFISQRKYYYTGKKEEDPEPQKVFIRYHSIAFENLKNIHV